MHHTLSLKESLCGCAVEITTLDGRRLRWQSTPGQVIKHGLVQCIEGEGFPQAIPTPRADQPQQQRQRQGRGRLLIYFTVEFPSELDDAALAAINSALPEVDATELSAPCGADTGDSADTKTGSPEEEGEPVVCVLEEVDLAAEPPPLASGGRGAGGDDEEGGDGGRQQQCAQQ